jgi:D-alanyl-D-alanine carboxypeptidase
MHPADGGSNSPISYAETVKRVLGALVGAVVAVAAVLPVASGATPRLASPHQEGGDPRAYILVDAKSNVILDARNAHEPLPPGSAVMLMTALTALQRIPNEDRVVGTPLAGEAPQPRIGVRAETTWESLDLVQAMLLASANDAAYALAEGAGKTLAGFAQEMKRVAEMMGFEDSEFADPAGLEGGDTRIGPTLMSAYDLAIAGVNALASPDLAEVALLTDFRVITPDGQESALRDSDNHFLEFYPGATGLKAGVNAFGAVNLVASAERDGRELVAVVMGAENAVASAAALLDAGFATKKTSKGIGDSIPETRITTIQSRLVALAGLPRPLGSPVIPPTGPKGANAPVSDAPPPTAPRPVEEDDEGGGGGGFPFLLVLLMLLVAGLVIAAVLRGQAVEREREARRVRERLLREARRRGTLTVLDPEEDDSDEVRIVRS